METAIETAEFQNKLMEAYRRVIVWVTSNLRLAPEEVESIFGKKIAFAESYERTWQSLPILEEAEVQVEPSTLLPRPGWGRLRKILLRLEPALERTSPERAKKEFKQLSQKIAKSMDERWHVILRRIRGET